MFLYSQSRNLHATPLSDKKITVHKPFQHCKSHCTVQNSSSSTQHVPGELKAEAQECQGCVTRLSGSLTNYSHAFMQLGCPRPLSYRLMTSGLVHPGIGDVKNHYFDHHSTQMNRELQHSQNSASQLDHCAQLGSNSTGTSVPTGAQFNAHQPKGD